MVRNRIILILCIVLSCIFVSHYGGRISYAIFYGTLLLPLSSLLYMFYVYLRFRIYQTIETKTTIKGEWIPYVFTLSNEDVITFTNVKVTFFEGNSSVKNLEFSKNYCLLPGQATNQTSFLRCHYRGEYEVGIESVLITDYLHLFTVRYLSPSHIRMQVYPKIISLNNPIIAHPKEDEKRSSYAFRLGDGLPDSETREYESGDSMKRIHWKSTARSGQLMTRKITPFTQLEVLFFLDLSKPAADSSTCIKIEDKILESALAVIHYFYQAKTLVKLFMKASMNEKVVANKASFYSFYDFCKEVHFHGSTPIGQWMEQYLQKIPSSNRILCVTHKIDTHLQYASHKAVTNGIDVMVVLVGKDLESETNKLDERVTLIPLHWDQDVSEVMEA